MVYFFIFLGIVALAGFFAWIKHNISQGEKRQKEEVRKSVSDEIESLRKQVEYVNEVLTKYSNEQWKSDQLNSSLNSFSKKLSDLISNMKNGFSESKLGENYFGLMKEEISQIRQSGTWVYHVCFLREDIQSNLEESWLLIKKSLILKPLLTDSFTRMEKIHPKKVWQDAKNEFESLINIDSLKKEWNSIYDSLSKMTVEEMSKIYDQTTMLCRATQGLEKSLVDLIKACTWVDTILVEEYLRSGCL